ncbi:MAG: DUF898 family protein [Zoogloeaceae bacterium]|jgi:uncharacterized membrane protein YjgN (DUF898 family)|nr:DUF898 family protein [Zoogloeaceae bacterium]
MPTPYQTLGLPEGAEIDTVRTAYGKALQRFAQQQQAGTPLPKEDFDALQAAYAELSSPERKALYDWNSNSAKGEAQAPPPASATIPAAAAPAVNADGMIEHKFQFTGSGGEYFRIWIINLLYSFLTLGIYSAWAKVRREQYFYRNTLLDGSGFDYHGDPKAILKGRVLAVLLLIIYAIAEKLSWPVYTGVLLVALPLLPWLVLRSSIFRSRNSSYRGLRFNFHGAYRTACAIFVPYALCVVVMLWGIYMAEASRQPIAENDAPQSLYSPSANGITRTAYPDAPVLLAQQETDAEEDGWDEDDEVIYAASAEDQDVEEEAATLAQILREAQAEAEKQERELGPTNPVYVAMTVLSFFVLFLGGPWFMRAISRFQLNHLAFAHARFKTGVRLGVFYRTYILASLIPLLPVLLIMIAVMILAFSVGPNVGLNTRATFIPVLVLLLIPLILLFYLGLGASQAYLNDRRVNAIWNETQLEGHRFVSTQTFWGLLVVLVLNFLLMMLTLGLYWPWARVRLARYRADHLALLTPPGALDDFIGQNPADQRAIGEEIADAFDFDIAL